MLLRILLALFSLATAQNAPPRELSVSAAISLRDVLMDAAKVYQQQSGTTVRFSFGASGELATQIKNGGRVDLFISAAHKQVDDLAKAGLTSGENVIIARNQLVLIVPKDTKNPPSNFADLSYEAKVTKLAIGEPKSVPAGEYAMQSLKFLKLDEALKPRLVFATNVRQVLAYVERGEVSAGLVYMTDAIQSGDKVRVVATAAEKSHQPIEYPAIVIKNAANEESARDFLKFLQSEPARTILKEKGFVVP